MKKLKLSTKLYNHVMFHNSKEKAFKIEISENFPYKIKRYWTEEDIERNAYFEHDLYMFCVQAMESFIDYNIQIKANTFINEPQRQEFIGETWNCHASFQPENHGVANAVGDNFPAVVIFVCEFILKNVINKEKK